MILGKTQCALQETTMRIMINNILVTGPYLTQCLVSSIPHNLNMANHVVDRTPSHMVEEP